MHGLYIVYVCVFIFVDFAVRLCIVYCMLVAVFCWWLSGSGFAVDRLYRCY